MKPYPKAKKVVRALLRNPAMLALSTPRIASDIRARFKVSNSTALLAIERARAA